PAPGAPASGARSGRGRCPAAGRRSGSRRCPVVGVVVGGVHGALRTGPGGGPGPVREAGAAPCGRGRAQGGACRWCPPGPARPPGRAEVDVQLLGGGRAHVGVLSSASWSVACTGRSGPAPEEVRSQSGKRELRRAVVVSRRTSAAGGTGQGRRAGQV